MSRFLTPFKISLLAIISVYTEGVVPATATLPVLSFLVHHVLPFNSKSPPLLEDQANAFSIQDLEDKLIDQPSGVPGRTIWDWVLKKLWGIDSFDSLHVFLDSFNDVLAKTRADVLRDRENGILPKDGGTRFSRTSPLGLFVRRTQVEFTRLQLDDCIALWKSFANYREPTRPMWQRRNPGAARAGLDANITGHNEETIQNLLYGDATWNQKLQSASNDDFEALLEFQIDKMQKMSLRLPAEMKKRFEHMVNSGATALNRSHYMRYLDAWKAGDYLSSFDHLHRYFDYTMQSRDRTFYQYALLNLAILQADFGCFAEAVAAMQETIATARENKDVACLNYSLSWLFHFGKAHPEELSSVQQTGVLGSDKEALSFLKAKAKDAGMWSLLSTTLLAEARQHQLSGESQAAAFESIAKSSQIILTKMPPNCMGAQMNMESSVFSRLGQRFLSGSCTELFLECYAGESSQEDELHFLCKVALQHSSKGRFHAGLELLDSVRPATLQVLKHQHFWTACMALLNVRWALWRSDTGSAERYITQLKANSFPSHDIAFTIRLYTIEFEICKGQYSRAMEILEDQPEDTGTGEDDIFQKIKIMILKAQIFDRAGFPQKGCSIAIRAASLAYRALYLTVLWDAISVLCKILVSLGERGAAVKLLKAILPQILETEDCELAGRAFSYLADAYMGLAGEAKAGSIKQREQMNQVLEYLEKGFAEYSRIEYIDGQCEMMAKKATVMRLTGDIVLANDCAAKYLDLQRGRRKDEVLSY